MKKEDLCSEKVLKRRTIRYREREKLYFKTIKLYIMADYFVLNFSPKD